MEAENEALGEDGPPRGSARGIEVTDDAAAAGMLEACYCQAMANLQVKNLPDELHDKLQTYAREEGRTLRDVVLEALRREVSRREFRTRLAGRDRVDLGRPAARGLEEARRDRDRELGS